MFLLTINIILFVKFIVIAKAKTSAKEEARVEAQDTASVRVEGSYHNREWELYQQAHLYFLVENYGTA